MVKNLPANAGSAGLVGSIPGSGRSPGKGNGTPLQYSCLENPMDRGALQATVHRVTKSQTQLSDFTHFTHSMTASQMPLDNESMITTAQSPEHLRRSNALTSFLNTELPVNLYTSFLIKNSSISCEISYTCPHR